MRQKKPGFFGKSRVSRGMHTLPDKLGNLPHGRDYFAGAAAAFGLWSRALSRDFRRAALFL